MCVRYRAIRALSGTYTAFQSSVVVVWWFAGARRAHSFLTAATTKAPATVRGIPPSTGDYWVRGFAERYKEGVYSSRI